MTYTVLPNSGQSLGVTRVPINTNFSLIQSVFALNHIGFNLTGAGKHKFVEMPEQSPPETTIVDEGALYVAQGIVSAQAELFFRREGQTGALTLTTKDFALTAMPMTACGCFVTNGAVLVPYLNMSNATHAGLGKYTINFPVPMVSQNYVYQLSVEQPAIGTADVCTVVVTAKGLSQLFIEFRRRSSGNNEYYDPVSFSVTIFGGHM